MTTTTESRPIVTDHTEIELDESGNQRTTHIVNCPEQYATTQEYLVESMVHGFEVEALCGHRWLPTRDPKRFPVCQPCVDVAMRIQREVFGA